ncbi:MAG TPA: DoxX family membrane protein [Steroidobacteraceae bacterium]|nr:DoxX family membrane protein [Steroidobacteraceae bacterium]
MRFEGFAHVLFAIALAAVAILGLGYGDFVPRGQPLPPWLPWREFWVHAFAVLLLLCSMALCLPRIAPLGAAIVAIYGVVWSALCGVQIFYTPSSVSAWYGFCEALAPLIGAWILYALLRWQSRGPATLLASEGAVRVAQLLFGLTCIFYGWSHFEYASYTAGMVPAWLPGHPGFAYATGVAHIAAGLGLAFGILPRLAGTLEAAMMSLFGLLVWVPSFFAMPKPGWATPLANEWSELIVSVMLAATAWLVATSLRYRPWIR